MNFLHHKTLLLSIITALLLGGCQEEIDIDLNDAEPKTVIEAEITDTLPPYLIRVSHTINFKEPNTFAGIANADVRLRDEAGNEALITSDSAGYYYASGIQSQQGKMFYLDVAIGEDTFSTSCKMPYVTEIDSLTMTTYAYGTTSMKTTEVYFTDKAGEANFYRIKYFVNNEFRLSYLYRDEDRDGMQITVTIFGDNFYDETLQLKTGDTILVELYSITEEVFNYFKSLRSTSSTNPANPLSNISGALGYFNLCTKRSRQIIVP
ncbi:MAG: DUF4249 domain-containing protein [Bacteroidales bacterium]|jgi:hypothetical protein|nr:DUF4249 domain-containing protein [Bacteroidales bacterium]